MHKGYIPEADICTYSSRKHHPKGEAFHKIASPIKEHLPQTLSFNSTKFSWCFLTGVGVNIWLFTACKNLSLLRLLQFFLSKINYPLNRLVSKKISACKENFGHSSRLERNSCPNQINQTPPPPLKGGPLIGVFPPTDCCKGSSTSGCDYSCCQYRRKHVSSAKCG